MLPFLMLIVKYCDQNIIKIGTVHGDIGYLENYTILISTFARIWWSSLLFIFLFYFTFNFTNILLQFDDALHSLPLYNRLLFYLILIIVIIIVNIEIVRFFPIIAHIRTYIFITSLLLFLYPLPIVLVV